MKAFFSSESLIWWVTPRWIRKVKYLKESYVGKRDLDFDDDIDEEVEVAHQG